jgi:hypothetical protein
MVYRRRGENSEWHFDSRCPQWPVLGCIQVESLKPEQGERICAECIKLGLRTLPAETSALVEYGKLLPFKKDAS